MTTEKRLAEIEERLELFKWVLTANGPMRKQSISHQLIGQDVPWLIEQVRRRNQVRAVISSDTPMRIERLPGD